MSSRHGPPGAWSGPGPDGRRAACRPGFRPTALGTRAPARSGRSWRPGGSPGRRLSRGLVLRDELPHGHPPARLRIEELIHTPQLVAVPVMDVPDHDGPHIGP